MHACISVVSNVFTTKIQLVGTKIILLSSMHIAIHQQAGCMHAKEQAIYSNNIPVVKCFLYLYSQVYTHRLILLFTFIISRDASL